MLEDDEVDENDYVQLNSSSRWARFMSHQRPSENLMVQLGKGEGRGAASPTPSWGTIKAQIDSKQTMDSLF